MGKSLPSGLYLADADIRVLEHEEVDPAEIEEKLVKLYEKYPVPLANQSDFDFAGWVAQLEDNSDDTEELPQPDPNAETEEQKIEREAREAAEAEAAKKEAEQQKANDDKSKSNDSKGSGDNG